MTVLADLENPALLEDNTLRRALMVLGLDPVKHLSGVDTKLPRNIRPRVWCPEISGAVNSNVLTRVLLALDQRRQVRPVIIREVALPLPALAETLHALLLPPCTCVEGRPHRPHGTTGKQLRRRNVAGMPLP